MEKQGIEKALLTSSIVCFLIMSASFLIMPLDLYNEKISSSAVNIISGLCFWIFLIGGCAAQIFLAGRRKRSQSPNETKNMKLGLISFFKNKFAIAADALLIMSIICCVAVLAYTNASGYICYVFLALGIFSFCMHCIFNGKNYYFVKQKEQKSRT